MSVENVPAHHHKKYYNPLCRHSVVSSRFKNIFHKDGIDHTTEYLGILGPQAVSTEEIII